MSLFFELLFTVCIILCGFHYVGYPILLRAIVRRRPPSMAAAGEKELVLPTIRLIVPVHNEEAVIVRKVANLGKLDYPKDRLSVVLALDGCADRSEELAREAIELAAISGICEITERRTNVGKIAVLNAEIAKATAELVALSDASALVGADTLLRAAVHFADPRVGVVCGTYQLLRSEISGEKVYWDYQRTLKADEAALAAPMGAHGAFYIFRRSLWTPLPPDTINDDFVLPLQIVARGYRAIYDQSIIAVELEQSKAKQDFRRRVRIGAGNVQQFVRLLELGHPRNGWLSFLFLSGKGLRALVPLLMIMGLIASAALAIAGHILFELLTIAAVISIIVSAICSFAGLELKPRPAALLSYFISGNLAALVGCVLFMFGLEHKVWKLSTSAKAAAAPHAG
jgi:cellulose synthase/poly-beta-1,6-N-acetylglucosamine synthase-like glycosyltransferase